LDPFGVPKEPGPPTTGSGSAPPALQSPGQVRHPRVASHHAHAAHVPWALQERMKLPKSSQVGFPRSAHAKFAMNFSPTVRSGNPGFEDQPNPLCQPESASYPKAPRQCRAEPRRLCGRPMRITARPIAARLVGMLRPHRCLPRTPWSRLRC
jgi:hypothetical protein